MDVETGSGRPLSRRLFARVTIGLERLWDEYRTRSFDRRPARDFRIVPFGGHGGPDGVVVRGRVVDDPEPAAAMEGEGPWTALRRNLARFRTDELPDVPLVVTVGDASVETRTDAGGYFTVSLDPDLGPGDAPWTTGEVRLAETYRGVTASNETSVRVRVPGPDATVAVVSDVDDTVLRSGAENALSMARLTLTGSFLTRVPVPGTPELYRGLASGGSGDEGNPFFYVSSSAWNLHGFLRAFLEHRGFPPGPLLLRDLLGTDENRTHATRKRESIAEVLALHPGLPLVLVGDSGQHDPRIYADVVEERPDRFIAVYIRDVDAGPDEAGVEPLSDAPDVDVPFLLAADSAAIAEHAADLGLLSAADVDRVKRTVAAERRDRR